MLAVKQLFRVVSLSASPYRLAHASSQKSSSAPPLHSTEFQWFELLNFVRAVIGVAACNSYLLLVSVASMLHVGLWIVFANYQWSIRKMSSKVLFNFLNIDSSYPVDQNSTIKC